MPSSRHSATAALLVLSISSTAPDVLVSGWVGPSVVSRAGRGVVRARSAAAGTRSSSSRSSCGCGAATSPSSSSSSDREDSSRGGERIEEGDRLIMMQRRPARSPPAPRRRDDGEARADPWLGAVDGLKKAGVGALAGLFLMAGGGGGQAAFADVGGLEPTSSVTVQDLQRYDGFEDYAAQGQQMEDSDVGCFANECKRETASCFTDGSCLKVCGPATSLSPFFFSSCFFLCIIRKRVETPTEEDSISTRFVLQADSSGVSRVSLTKEHLPGVSPSVVPSGRCGLFMFFSARCNGICILCSVPHQQASTPPFLLSKLKLKLTTHVRKKNQPLSCPRHAHRC